MLLRALLLMLFSSSVWSAGVQICIDPIVTIDSIVYVDDVDSASEPDPDQTETIKTIVEINPCDNETVLTYGVFLGGSSLFIIKNNSGLVYRSIVDGVVQNGWLLPEDDANFNVAILARQKTYIYSQTKRLLYYWDSQLASWVDATAEYALPIGEYTGLRTDGYNLYFSVEEGADKGFWKLSNEVIQLSEIPASEARVAQGNNGLVQIVKSEIGSAYNIINIENKGNTKKLDLKFDVTGARSYKTSTGTLFNIYGQSTTYLYWDGLNNITDKSVVAPAGVLGMKGCFTSNGDIFCSFVSADNMLQFYKLDNGVFDLETEFESQLLSSPYSYISSYNVAGKRRFISVVDVQTWSHTIYKYSPENGLQQLMDIDGLGEASFSYVTMNPDQDKMHWVAYNQEKTAYNVYEISLVGETGFEKGIEEEEEEFEEREETGDDEFVPPPRAEISGAFSMYYLFALSLLLLTLPRRRL